jgi:hypothetical protein
VEEEEGTELHGEPISAIDARQEAREQVNLPVITERPTQGETREKSGTCFSRRGGPLFSFKLKEVIMRGFFAIVYRSEGANEMQVHMLRGTEASRRLVKDRDERRGA